MRPSVKLAALACIAIIGVGAWLTHRQWNGAACSTVTLTGWISPDTFFANRDRLAGCTASNKKVVVKDSSGGNWESALALGVLIHRHGWDVEIEGLCASACAIFIFPAGKVKYLHRHALLVFHGGPHQANLREQYEAYDRAKANPPAPAGSGARTQVLNAQAGKEGYGVHDPDGAADRRRIRQFLSLEDSPTEVGLMTQLVDASDRLYDDMGVNLLLPTYGQVGRYEPTYKSYRYGGFRYPLDSLRRLGVANIEVIGGEWRPERHPDYHAVYEVTFP